MKNSFYICLMIVFLGFGLVYGASANGQELVVPENFGYGVYYFYMIANGGHSLERRKDRRIFGRSLAAFRAKNPNLRIVSITAQSDSAFGTFVLGYWVVCESR